MNTFLTETMIFPPALWFGLAANREALIEAHEHYQKRSFRNRYVLYSARGPVPMSIPLCAGKNESMPIRSVRISRDAPWQREHKRTLQTLYGRSPFYIYYADELSELLDSQTEFLFDFNSEMIHWILQKLNLNIRINHTESYDQHPNPDRWDLRSRLNPRKLGMVPFPPMPGLPARSADISILDLLFQMGPEAGLWLLQQKGEQWEALVARSL